MLLVKAKMTRKATTASEGWSIFSYVICLVLVLLSDGCFFMNLCQVQRKELKKRAESVRWENPRAQDNLRAICVCVLLPYPPCAVDNGTFECKVKSDKSRQIKCAIFSFTIVWYKAWLQR
jgi:hypothetical protein